MVSIELVCVVVVAAIVGIVAFFILRPRRAPSYGRHRASETDNATQTTDIFEAVGGPPLQDEPADGIANAVTKEFERIGNTDQFDKLGDHNDPNAEQDTDFLDVVQPALVRPYIEPEKLGTGWFAASFTPGRKRPVWIPPEDMDGPAGRSSTTHALRSPWSELPAGESGSIAKAA